MNSGVQRLKQVHSIQTALTSTKPLGFRAAAFSACRLVRWPAVVWAQAASHN
jgi:hypothetical protein